MSPPRQGGIVRNCEMSRDVVPQIQCKYSQLSLGSGALQDIELFGDVVFVSGWCHMTFTNGLELRRNAVTNATSVSYMRSSAVNTASARIFVSPIYTVRSGRLNYKYLCSIWPVCNHFTTVLSIHGGL